MNAPNSLRAPAPRGGFSLIEVLFAIAILMLGILGILALLIAGINSSNLSGGRSQATIEVLNLHARVLGTSNLAGERIFLKRMRDFFYRDPGNTGPGNIWTARQEPCYVQRADFPKVWNATYNVPWNDAFYADSSPVRVDRDSDFFWSCRAGNRPFCKLPKKDPPATPVVPNNAMLLPAYDAPWPNPASNPSAAQLKTARLPTGLCQIVIGVWKNWRPNKEPVAVYTTYLAVEF
jgi:hypothetical protein